jgi:hypothetical protein
MKAHDLENQNANKDSRQIKTQGFNSFQVSPNWFLGM